MHVKRFLLLLVVLVVCVLVAGCVETTYEVTVGGDGSADVVCRIGMEKEMMEMAKSQGGDEDPFKDGKKQFEEMGFTVSDYDDEESGKMGVEAKKSFDSVADISASDINSVFQGATESGGGAAPADGDKDEKAKDETPFFKVDGDKLTVDGTVSLGGDESSAEAEAMMGQMGDMFDFKFVLNLPEKATDHNATEVKEDGKQLIWKLGVGKNTEVNATATLPGGTGNMMMYIIIGVVVVVIIIIIIVVASSKGQSGNQNMTENQRTDTWGNEEGQTVDANEQDSDTKDPGVDAGDSGDDSGGDD